MCSPFETDSVTIHSSLWAVFSIKGVYQVDTRFKQVFKSTFIPLLKANTMSQGNTKTRILDGAEQLFAREGFHNTSLRALTSLADVNLASVNYHFGSKESLLHSVIERRLLPLNRIRQEKIEAVLAKARINLAIPVLQTLFEALHQALPQLSPAVLMARLQFIMGTMSHVMCMSSHSLLINSELPPPLDHSTLVEQLIKFVLAGLEAPE